MTKMHDEIVQLYKFMISGPNKIGAIVSNTANIKRYLMVEKNKDETFLPVCSLEIKFTYKNTKSVDHMVFTIPANDE